MLRIRDDRHWYELKSMESIESPRHIERFYIFWCFLGWWKPPVILYIRARNPIGRFFGTACHAAATIYYVYVVRLEK